MTPARTKELLPILIAYANGKAIEYSEDNIEWFLTTTPPWDDKIYYRIKTEIKSEPKIVPFTLEDRKEFREKWVASGSGIYKGYSRISQVDENGVVISNGFPYSYINFLKYFIFEDGSKCGKYIND